MGKCIIVGDVGVGKTCIINRFDKNTFLHNYKCTIGVDFGVKDFKILGQSFKLNDTAGQERFRSITKSYYRNSHVAVIVFDFSSVNTLSSIRKWSEEVLENAFHENSTTGQLDQPLLFVVGTKKDLICESTLEYLEKQAMKIAKELNARYWSVSSRTGDNIDNLFRQIAAFAFVEIILRELEMQDLILKNFKNDKKIYANHFLNPSTEVKLNKKNTSKDVLKDIKKKFKSKCCRF